MRGRSYSPASVWESAPAAAADKKLRYTERSVAEEAAPHCHCRNHWPQGPRTASLAGARSWSCGDLGPRGTGTRAAAVTCWARSDAAGGRAPPSRRTSGPRGVSCRTDH